jgi:chromate transporter
LEVPSRSPGTWNAIWSSAEAGFADDGLEGLTSAQLAPGRLAVQLVIYLGYLRAGSWEPLWRAWPSFLAVLAIAAAYVRYSGLACIQPVFYGVGAGVIAILARSA